MLHAPVSEFQDKERRDRPDLGSKLEQCATKAIDVFEQVLDEGYSGDEKADAQLRRDKLTAANAILELQARVN